MRIGFLVDATCDLPESYFSSGDVLVMPISVRIKDHVLVDSRDQAATREYLEGNIAKEASEAETQAFTPEQISALFLERLVVEYDYVFCLTVTRTAARSTTTRPRRATASCATTIRSARPPSCARPSRCG